MEIETAVVIFCEKNAFDRPKETDTMLKAFVSSTCRGFEEHRAYVIEKLQGN